MRSKSPGASINSRCAMNCYHDSQEQTCRRRRRLRLHPDRHHYLSKNRLRARIETVKDAQANSSADDTTYTADTADTTEPQVRSPAVHLNISRRIARSAAPGPSDDAAR